MQTLRAALLSALCLIPSISLASDVDYQLNNNALTTINQPKTPEPPALSIVDRAWNVPGVEQSLEENELVEKSGLHLRLETSFCARLSPTRNVSLPQWINELVWPLTRELWTRSDGTLRGFDSEILPEPVIPAPRRGFDGINLATQQ